MPILTRRFERIKTVLNQRMFDLTVVLDQVEKPHNLSAILRSCDAVGVLEAHVISKEERLPTFNSTAQGSQKWVALNKHKKINTTLRRLKEKGFQVYGTTLEKDARDYRECNFCEPTAFVLGAEKWGLTKEAIELVDETIFIPMRGMVQSLNVSVAAATLLFEALRQRQDAGLVPKNGEGIDEETYRECLFQWSYPQVAEWCKINDRPYPELNENGEIIEDLPRDVKLRY